MRNPVWANIISNSILRLNKEYSDTPIGEHIIHALYGGDLYNTSDKDLAESLSTYLAELEVSDDNQDDEYNE